MKIRHMSRKMAASNQVRLDVWRLRDESVGQEYKRDFAESMCEPSDSDDPETLWLTSKPKS